jgi:hydroxylamine dehydrogenase
MFPILVNTKIGWYEIMAKLEAEFSLLIIVQCVLLAVFLLTSEGFCEDQIISDSSQDCIACHSSVTPAIVADWRRSAHAKITLSKALEKPELERRVSVKLIPDQLKNVAVSCAECHLVNSEAHTDTFDHNDQKVHLTVTPKDCATCHPVEESQFQKNIMAFAHTNLSKNPVFQTLLNTVTGTQELVKKGTVIQNPDEKTTSETCYSCHGTELKVINRKARSTDYGDMEFVQLSGWPNDGVGRLNPDGSRGSCSACHTRHQFAIQMARKPYTCSQCHKGPDVPGYKIYSVSKHGAIFSSLHNEWNFRAVPWTVGKDFSAPTCSTCHMSLIVDPEGTVVVNRTHQMNDRLPWRTFGLIYAHAHPKSPDTSIIRNADGLPLPTTYLGVPASDYLIGPDEMKDRKETLQKVCLSCHTPGWVAGHWARFENTIQTTNTMTLTATKILIKAWDQKLADKTNPFDEAIEKQWTEQWLFYANSTRLSSAMLGADYGVFDRGWWFMSKTIQDMLDRLSFLADVKKR